MPRTRNAFRIPTNTVKRLPHYDHSLFTRPSSDRVMILGIGVDVLSLPRFEAMVRRRGVTRVARRVCCPSELVLFRKIAGRPSEGDDPSLELTGIVDDMPSRRSDLGAEMIGAHNGRDGSEKGVGEGSTWDRQIRFLSTRCVLRDPLNIRRSPNPSPFTLHTSSSPCAQAESSWAVKEAAYKSLHPSLPRLRASVPNYRLSFHSFELLHSGTAPTLRLLQLDPPQRELDVPDGPEVGGVGMMVSVSHDAGVVVGLVVAVDRGLANPATAS